MKVSNVDRNATTYASSKIVKSYKNLDELYPAEQSIFDSHERQFAGDVLDIAIGAGRTTRALLPRSRRYIGIDFSKGMIDAAKIHFPLADLRQMDMRDVPEAFKGDKFDAILISFNGIDYISWEDRNALLKRLRSLLNSDGILAFSTHDFARVDSERGFNIREDLRPSLSSLRDNPIDFVKRLVKFPVWTMKAWNNRRRLKHLEQIHEGYAYINDSGENYGLLTMYVAVPLQVEVLKACGYEKVAKLRPWLKEEPSSFNYFVASMGVKALVGMQALFYACDSLDLLSSTI